ncbi:MAG TPA: SCP2 sterol-binding domain-containing protein [Pseudolabrys sp.]|nr:SCP2 sterol-binding domain-containing protein [Pseudolabrys sp.]
MPGSSRRAGPSAAAAHGPLSNLPGLLLTFAPLAIVQPILGRIAAHVAKDRPELYARLGAHARKKFLIDPVDFPFVLILAPEVDRPNLRAYRRTENPRHDAAISGTFFNLLGLIDGSQDGDALFFSRNLKVTGDTEAVVALRNALDDFEGSALDSVLGSFGPLAKPAALIVSGLRALDPGPRHV